MTYHRCLLRYCRHAALTASAPPSPTPWLPFDVAVRPDLSPMTASCRLWLLFLPSPPLGRLSSVPVRCSSPPLLLSCDTHRSLMRANHSCCCYCCPGHWSYCLCLRPFDPCHRPTYYACPLCAICWRLAPIIDANSFLVLLLQLLPP